VRKDLRGVVIGVPRARFFERCDDQVLAGVRRGLAVLEGLGARIVDVELLHAPLADAIGRTIVTGEAGSLHEELLERAGAAAYPRDFAARLLGARRIRALDYARPTPAAAARGRRVRLPTARGCPGHAGERDGGALVCRRAAGRQCRRAGVAGAGDADDVPDDAGRRAVGRAPGARATSGIAGGPSDRRATALRRALPPRPGALRRGRD
jgi:hypothetical protein